MEKGDFGRKLLLGARSEGIDRQLSERNLEAIALALIVIFVSLAAVFARIGNLEGIASFDFWAYVARAKQFELEGYINPDYNVINTWDIRGSSSYPPGFPVLLYVVKGITGIDYGYLSLIFSSLLWSGLSLSSYSLVRRYTGSKSLGILSAFFMATIISGSNMLGPIFAHPINLDLLIILLTLLVTSVSSYRSKVALNALLIPVIFLTHRSGTVFWFLFLVFLILFFLPQRMKQFKSFALPMIVSTILAVDIAAVAIIIMGGTSLDSFAGYAGVIPDLERIQSFKAVLVSVLSGLSFLSIYSLVRIKTQERMSLNLQTLHFSRIDIIAFSVLPILIIGMFLRATISINFSEGFGLSGFVGIWGEISETASSNIYGHMLRTGLYIWHLNLLPIFLLAPGIWLVLRYRERNPLIIVSLSMIALLSVFFLTQMVVSSPIKIIRIYLYAAPFIFFFASIGMLSLLSKAKMRYTFLLVILMVLSPVLLAVSIPYTTSEVTSSEFMGIEWAASRNDVVGTTAITAQYARGLGHFHFVSYRIDSARDVQLNLYSLKKEEVQHLYLDDATVKGSRLVGFPFDRVYSGKTSNIYYRR